MIQVVEGPDISLAWQDAVASLLLRGGAALNLVVAVRDPTAESPRIRRALDKAIASLRDHKHAPPSVDTSAATIFPVAFYQPHAPDPAGHLFELERLARPAIRAHPENTRGTYFERFVAYPGDQGPVNQLAAVLEKLRRARQLRHRNGNKYELPVFSPARDKNPFGFPCLSHVTLTLSEGRLHATALYRNQYFISRAYGNLLGLGALQQFLAAESGFKCGTLVCIASHAELEIQTFGRNFVEALINSFVGPDK